MKKRRMHITAGFRNIKQIAAMMDDDDWAKMFDRHGRNDVALSVNQRTIDSENVDNGEGDRSIDDSRSAQRELNHQLNNNEAIFSRHRTSSTSSLPLSESKEEPLFPTILHKLLEDAEEQNFGHIVSWGVDESSFKVHRIRDFEAQVLSRYFKMTKWKSFTRQLHNYGFEWIRRGPDKGGYQSSKFSRRLDPTKCQRVYRQPMTTKTGSRMLKNDDGTTAKKEAAKTENNVAPQSSEQDSTALQSIVKTPAREERLSAISLTGRSHPQLHPRTFASTDTPANILPDSATLYGISVEPRTIEEMVKYPQVFPGLPPSSEQFNNR